MNALQDKVYHAVSDVFGVPFEKVNDSLSASDVSSWDSFNMINLLMVLQTETNVSLSAEDAKDLTSVKQILELLEARGAR